MSSLGWGFQNPNIGLVDSVMPQKTHPMAVGIESAGVARYERRHRRKLCCGDYNPAHVESGRLQGFPVEGAFASVEIVWRPVVMGNCC